MTEQSQKPKRGHSFLLKLALLIALLVFAVAIGLNMLKQKKIGEYLAHMPESVSPVTAMTVQSSEWTPVINTTGLVRPNQGAMLSAEAAGTVKSINVQSGQPVQKGQVILELDSSVEQATLQASEAQLPSARATYQRYASLLRSQSISQLEVDSAKATYDQLQATIQSLRSTIDRRKIVAPFDGILGIVKVNAGQYITAGTEIVRVEDNSKMKVDFSVSQNELENLKIGQSLTATADARLGETFAARVTAIEPAISTTTGLIDVQATFEPADGAKLVSGMFTRLSLALPTEKNQIVIPQVAITYNMYGETAYVLEKLNEEDKTKALENPANKDHADKLYRAKQITVFTKDRQGIYAQLKGDEIKIGDQVVTGGQQRLSNGALVLLTDKQGVGTTQPAVKNNL